MFRCIVADPPWEFPSGSLWDRPKSRPSENYPTLSVDDICSLPVRDTSDENCALWLWAPTHHLVRGLAFQVAEAWGFRPMTTAVWVKPQMGVGYYLRNSHENVLLAVKGKYRLRVRDQLSWFVAPRRRHSEKPDEFFAIVERSCAGPYLELFARSQRQGWVVWGNELPDTLGWGFTPSEWRQVALDSVP